MVFLLSHFEHFVIYFWLSAVMYLAFLIHRYTNSPLRKTGIPGPFLGQFSSMYRAYHVLRRDWHRKLNRLHAVYGPVVWIAPTEVSISDPKYRDIIYSFASKNPNTFFKKSKRFETGQFNQDFSFIFEQDPPSARMGKYAMAHMYSEANLKDFERNFDNAVTGLIDGIRKYHVKTGTSANLYNWMHYYMFDTILELSNDKSGGFCEKGEDVGWAVFGVRIIFDVVGTLMTMPITLVLTNRAIRKYLLNMQLEWVYTACLRYQPKGATGGLSKMERIHEIRKSAPKHFMERFYQAQIKMREHNKLGNEVEGVTNNLFNLIAGAVGVTPNVLCSAINHIHANPKILSKVRAELDSLPSSPGTIPLSYFFPFDNPEASKIPYVLACIKEAIRLTPVVAFILTREVPATGFTAEGYYIPPGYNVGMSGWSVHHDKAYFGADAARFRPERWFEIHPILKSRDGVTPLPMRVHIERGWIPFGAGARVCIGRHLAANSIVKGLGRLFTEFDMEVLTPPQESFGLVVEHVGMIVSFKERVNQAKVELEA